jgi:hypothetical protein
MPFQKGRAKTGGRRKKTPQQRLSDRLTAEALRERCQRAAQYAFETLLALMSDKAFPHVRLVAAREILDRAFGKPAQNVAVEAEIEVEHRGITWTWTPELIRDIERLGLVSRPGGFASRFTSDDDDLIASPAIDVPAKTPR